MGDKRCEKNIYRGKATDDSKEFAGKWIVGSYIETSRPCICHFVMTEDGVFENRMTEVIPETVGQCVGKCDKNNKRIFEGDILKQESNAGVVFRTTTIAKVEYSKRNCSFGAYDVKSGLPTLMLCSIFSHSDILDVEVVGNIIDNPELAKGATRK